MIEPECTDGCYGMCEHCDVVYKDYNIKELHKCSNAKIEVVHRTTVKVNDVVLMDSRLMLVVKVIKDEGTQIVLSLLTDRAVPFETTQWLFYYKVKTAMYKIIHADESTSSTQFFTARTPE